MFGTLAIAPRYLQLAGVQAGLNSFIVSLFAFLPHLIGFAIVLLVGYLIVTAVVRVLRFALNRANFERHIGHTRLGQTIEKSGTTLANIVILTVKWILILIVVVYAITELGIASLTASMNAILGWIPDLAAVAIIVFVGALAASWIGSMIENTLPKYGVGGGRLIGLAVELLIYAVVFNYAMIQIGFAQGILFMITEALAWGMAAALAIGLGVALAYSLREVIPPMITGSTTVASTLKEGQSVEIEGVSQAGGTVKGKVSSVGMFNTIIQREEGGYMILPNNLLMDKPIIVQEGSEPPRPFEHGMQKRMSELQDKYEQQQQGSSGGGGNGSQGSSTSTIEPATSKKYVIYESPEGSANSSEQQSQAR